MKRKTALTAITIFALVVSLVAGMQVVEVAEANPFYWCIITIHSPQNGSNPPQPVQVNFTARSAHEILPPQSFFYIIDGQNKKIGINVTETQFVGIQGGGGDYIYSGQIHLNLLSDGTHNVSVYWGNRLKDGTLYTIDTPAYSGTTATFSIGNTTTLPSQSPFPTTEGSPTPNPTPTPTPDPTPSPSINPTQTPSPGRNESFSPSPTLTLTPSLTQQITSDPTQTPKPDLNSNAAYALNSLRQILGIVALGIVVVAGTVIVYFKRRKEHRLDE